MLCRSRAGYSCVLLACMLAWAALYGAKKHMARAHGSTFLPFYSAEIRFLSEKRSQVARPQRETRILIEKGNKVARPPFHSRIFIQKGNTVARPPSQILRVWRVIKKGRWWQKSLFQQEFLLYFNGTMGNSCKIIIK